MDAIDVLLSRQSTKAALLSDPAPDDAQLLEILQTGMSAPDHGAIRPWRFKVIRGDARGKLSDVFEAALKQRQPDADQEAIDNIRSKPMRSPLILVVGAEVMENHPKVPVIEQVLATAGAAQNILNACYAKGVGAVMVTGWVAFDPNVKEALGFAEKDTIVGFIYLGAPPDEARVKKRPDAADYLENWTG